MAREPAAPPVEAAAPPWWTLGWGELAMLGVCAWTWAAPLGAQPSLYFFICVALVLELISLGPLVLGAGAAMRPASPGPRIVSLAVIAVVPCAAFAMFGLGSGLGQLWALVASALFLWRLREVGALGPRAGLDPRRFVLQGLFAILLLMGLIVLSFRREWPAFGAAWPSPTAMGFASDDPEAWIASPPRVLASACIYYAVLVLMRWFGALRLDGAAPGR